MSRSKTLVGIIVLGMSLGASGCANKMSLSSEKMCTSHGGTWNGAAHTCNGLAAQTTCESMIGSYNRAAQICEFNP
jgi:hypothetical protein